MSGAYRIDPCMRADDEIRRVMGERVERAQQSLALPAERRAEGVHEARKRLKEMRAVARLVRPRLGSKRFRRTNARFRDIARGLAELRDAAALVEAWDKLAAAQPRRFASPAMHRVRERLAARGGDGAADDEGGAPAAIATAQAGLAEAARELESWPLEGAGFALLGDGLERSLRDGARRLHEVDDGVTDTRLHEWRKRVKDHWYHTCLLQPAWPAMLDHRRRLLKELSDALGDDHDLAMMQALMAEEPEVFGAVRTREAAARALGERRAGLQRQALAAGRRLYAEAPDALAARWRAYWRLTRRGR